MILETRECMVMENVVLGESRAPLATQFAYQLFEPSRIGSATFSLETLFLVSYISFFNLMCRKATACGT